MGPHCTAPPPDRGPHRYQKKILLMKNLICHDPSAQGVLPVTFHQIQGRKWLAVCDTCHIRLLVVISKQQVYCRQECIPVGCVPSAAVTISGGVCPGVSSQGVSAQDRGVCLGGCLPGGVSAKGGSAWGGLQHTHTREQNHRRLWKHKLAATTLRTVNILERSWKNFRLKKRNMQNITLLFCCFALLFTTAFWCSLLFLVFYSCQAYENNDDFCMPLNL